MKLVLKPKDILSWATIIVVVMLTDTVLFTQNSNNSIVLINSASIIFLALLSIVDIVRLILRNKEHLSTDIILDLMAILCLLSTMVVRGESFSSYALKTCLILISIKIGCAYTIEKFSQRYIVLLRVISFTSIITFFFGSKIISTGIFPTIISNTGKRYTTLFFSNICHEALNRNFGPFWEPGAFQFYLILGLLLRFFCIEDKKWIVFDTIIFSLALVTTFSTTGIIAMMACYVCLVLSNTGLKMRYKAILLVVMLIFTDFVLANDYANELIFGKLSQGIQRASVRARVYSNEGLLNVFVTHPVFGGGMSGTPNLINNMYGMKVSITNAILVNFAEFGLIYGLIQVALIYKFCSNLMLGKAAWQKWLCILSVALSLVGESFMLSLMVTGVFLIRRSSVRHENNEKLLAEDI